MLLFNFGSGLSQMVWAVFHGRVIPFFSSSLLPFFTYFIISLFPSFLLVGISLFRLPRRSVVFVPSVFQVGSLIAMARRKRASRGAGTSQRSRSRWSSGTRPCSVSGIDSAYVKRALAVCGTSSEGACGG